VQVLIEMKADFIFFMTIAAICFSGLLFTLWQLAQLEPENTWTVTSIAWLMTQVWFGERILKILAVLCCAQINHAFPGRKATQASRSSRPKVSTLYL